MFFRKAYCLQSNKGYRYRPDRTNFNHTCFCFYSNL